MSRKPFSEVTESYFRNEMREPLVRGHDNRSAACLLANAAIAQDKEYALRRIREENHEGMIYYRERDEARAERDTLREENERLKMEYTEAETAFENLIQDYREGRDKAQVKLAEAVKVIEAIDHELGRPREVPDANWPAPIVNASDLARAFLEKVKA